MAYLNEKDIKTNYTESKKDAQIWREDYPAYERLANNDLMPNLDPTLPEVNDGSLAAALFKLPKRIVPSNLSGTVRPLDRDEAWVGVLANLVMEKDIIPYANTQAPFIRKWKDAVRKAAIYGSVPLITLFVDDGNKRHADFIVAQPQDVTLEQGKVSDSDSDLMYWDVYFTKIQLESMIEQAKEENKPDKTKTDDEYNKWNVQALKTILDGGNEEERSSIDSPKTNNDKGVRPKGFKFCVVTQKGVNAPFYMYFSDTNIVVREWSNPDPTGDQGIHFLYCYQDLINPYGTGIVKLAGGTQNVLDYMRQSDVLATQLGLRPPINVRGNTDNTDIDSIIYEQDALWFSGDAEINREELASGVYTQLPNRIAMYKTSLNQLIPLGDTSIGASAGDPQYSKTPAGVKFQAASLSIDDEDFKDNLFVTYELVMKSMINVHFSNMQGEDIMKVSDEEREMLIKAGMDFPVNEEGEMGNELEVIWDDVRANFEFEIDPTTDKAKDDADKLEGLVRVLELAGTDPAFDAKLQASKKRLDYGELLSEAIKLTSDNDKILVDIAPEEEAAMQEEMEAPQTAQPTPEEMQANVQEVMATYGVDENTALTALAAEAQGLPIEEITAKLQSLGGQ